MGRPRKYNADYFPHDSYLGDTREIVKLIDEMGLAGYGIYMRMLELLAREDHYELDLEKNAEYLRKRIGISRKKFDKFIEICENLALFSKNDGKIFSKYLKMKLHRLDRKRKENEKNDENFPEGIE